MKRVVKLILAFVILALPIMQSYGQETRLHPFYEQNGDCYVLVGEGNARAVWAEQPGCGS